MPRRNHTHKYMKQTTGSSPVWRCMLDDCNHYMPSHLESLVVGRTSICWDCDDKFKLNVINMKEAKPRCDDCSPYSQALTNVIKEKGI